MIPLGKGNFRLEPSDWWSVFCGAVIVIGSMAGVGLWCDRVKKKGRER